MVLKELPCCLLVRCAGVRAPRRTQVVCVLAPVLHGL